MDAYHYDERIPGRAMVAQRRRDQNPIRMFGLSPLADRRVKATGKLSDPPGLPIRPSGSGESAGQVVDDHGRVEGVEGAGEVLHGDLLPDPGLVVLGVELERMVAGRENA